jgi:hypothetical protein
MKINENKIFVFGDSYTKGHGCLENEEFYNKYKRDENDKIWCNIISENLMMELINFGVGLYSNDKIIDSVIEKYNLIKKNDIVLIQKTFSHRIDIPNINNDKLITIAPGMIDYYADYSKNDIEKLNYILFLSDSELYKKRQDLRFEFLVNILIDKGVNCILWNIMNYLNLERIIECSNGEIVDHHWSFNGHREMANNILNLIKNNTLYEVDM